MDFARSLIGTKEVPGAGNSPTIMGWAKGLGNKVLGMAYNADSTPWCGLFVGHVMRSVGLPVVPICVRASAWDKWGDATTPCYGALVRFQREGGGHVGILTGQTKTQFRVLGGNQSDQVNETLIDKSRAVAFRWPTGVTNPKLGLPMVAGGKSSKNEA